MRSLGVQIVLKKYQAGVDPTVYLDQAHAHGLQVLAWFPGVYAGGIVTPGAADPWVAKVKSHPALFGYVSVIEPAATGTNIDLGEMQTLYRRLTALDPMHPVVVSYGHLWKIGAADNPVGRGVADIFIAESYPVVFPSAAYPTGWVTSTGATLRAVRSVVATQAPGTPVWITVPMHEYFPSNRRQPSYAEILRQVRHGFDDLGGSGVVLYPWHTSSNYSNDLSQNLELQDAVRAAIARLREGYFDR